MTDTRAVSPGTPEGTVALVAGATRGAGRAIAVELARAGFHVYATGRSSRTTGPSEIGRPETIEETGDLIAAAGGTGAALVVDHEDPASVAEVVASIEREEGRLDLLVNDIFGGDRYMEWDKPLWEHDWAGGLRMLEMGVHTHLITCRAAIPLMLRTAEAQGSQGLVVEMTDGTSEANADFRRNVGFYYDLVKANVERIVKGLTVEMEDSPVTAVGVTPGWLCSEKMLENFGVTEANWRDALKERPGFGISESPTYVAYLCRQRRCGARQGRRRRPMGGHDHQRSPARGRVRHHGHGREPAGLLGLPSRLRVGEGRRSGHRPVSLTRESPTS
ncbi:MAG TPA: SDR family NAD(P)-dependent oxidoreductase [Gaiellaceae bacterium]|nr:SDR family NAD(P)-dependent oxidoreductase [Gaiellaceae bacterium]HKI21842.1 SDR family NAD(P)-dependent oxidoreductase [Gaiellaceae bacterium]